ncbi:MAG: 1-deoxy-D-xylulose-5-phosphate reductoisomerase [Elusimicrobia bacterium]|nr:1-deoxy-D-xylulose-5-phosphate reductoisomerase [Elusimicrobiota bacterium]
MSLVILGASGSVGSSALRAAEALGLKVMAASVNSRTDLIPDLIEKHKPCKLVITDSDAYSLFIQKHGKKIKDTKILFGAAGIDEIVSAEDTETVINAISGLAGLSPTIKALKAGKRVGMANKESIVMGWHLIKDEMQYPDQLIPVDSEHSAVFQLMRGRDSSSVERIILTASGGAVYSKSFSELEKVTASDCLKHPTWNMGDKITVDSATLMNKGLEVIEASRLFDFSLDRIGVYIHPQSLVHALLELKDGSLLAHMAPADMIIPVGYAVSYPDTPFMKDYSLTVENIAKLEFSRPDREKFPALDLAIRAAEEGIGKTVLLCAADEVAVGAFLAGRADFNDIYRVIERVLNMDIDFPVDSEEEIRELYNRGMLAAESELKKL